MNGCTERRRTGVADAGGGWATCLGAAAAVALSACGATNSSPKETITLEAVLSLGGTRGDIGRGDAMRAAAQFINRLDKLPGLTVAVRLNDAESVEANATAIATQLRDEKQVPVLITAGTETSIPVIRDVAIASKIFVLATATTTPSLTKTYGPLAEGYFVRTSPPSDVAAAALAKMAYDDGVRKLGVVYGDDAFGVSYKNDLTAAFTALGGVISSAQKVSAGTVAASYATELAAAGQGADQVGGKPAVAVNVGPAVMRTLLRDAANAGRSYQWYGAHTTRSIEIFAEGNATQAEGMKGVSARLGTPERFAVYQREFGTVSSLDPASTWYANVFDSVMVYALCLARGARTAEQFKDTVRRVTNSGSGIAVHGLDDIEAAFDAAAAGIDVDYQGASGPFDFDAEGNVSGGYQAFVVSAGGFVYGSPVP